MKSWNTLSNLTTFRWKNVHSYTVHVAGWGDRFDFGFHDKTRKRKGTYNNPTTYSSCVTTHESPFKSQFQSCDTKEVISS